MYEIIILLEEKKKLWVQGLEKNLSNPVPIKLISLLAQAGYIMSDEFQYLISPEDEKRYLDILSPYFSKVYGIGRSWKTVWGNKLPDSIETQRAIQLGLYANPDLLDEVRSKIEIPDFWEQNHWKPESILRPGYDSDLTEITTSFFKSNLPVGNNLLPKIEWILENRRELVEIPDKIPVKENLSLALCHGFGENLISGVTDILRTATWMSNKTVNSPQKTRIKLNRGMRQKFLGLLENYLGKTKMKWCLQDSKRYKEVWKILAYQCHPDKKRYPKSFEFFGGIQRKSEDMLHGWSSKLQRAYDTKNYDEVLRLLSQRPSEFVRKYDSLLRKAWEEQDTSRVEKIQDSFMKLEGVPGKVLFELYSYYGRRNLEIKRSFKDKRGVRIFYDPLEPISEDLIDIARVGLIQTLREGWRKKDTYSGKKVCLNIPEGYEFSVSLRNCVMDKTEPMYPGQRIEFPTTGQIRFFSQWLDPLGVEDLDLHAWLLRGDDLTVVSWNCGFQSSNQVVTHSGDIRHQRGNCAEYVTVDYTKPVPYEWMLVTVQNYDNPRLCDVENWIGVSKITGDCPGQNWIPKEDNTLFRGRVTSEAKNMAAFIVNLQEGWARIILEGVDGILLGNNDLIKQYIIRDRGLDLRMLLTWYVEDTGGEVVSDEGDIVINPGDECIYDQLLG